VTQGQSSHLLYQGKEEIVGNLRITKDKASNTDLKSNARIAFQF